MKSVWQNFYPINLLKSSLHMKFSKFFSLALCVLALIPTAVTYASIDPNAANRVKVAQLISLYGPQAYIDCKSISNCQANSNDPLLDAMCLERTESCLQQPAQTIACPDASNSHLAADGKCWCDKTGYTWNQAQTSCVPVESYCPENTLYSSVTKSCDSFDQACKMFYGPEQ